MAHTMRHLTSEDLDLFYTFFSAMIVAEFPEYPVPLKKDILSRPEMWSREAYTRRFADPNRSFFAFFEDDNLIACLEAVVPFGGVSLCSWLLVSHEHQKQGIGKKLLQKWEVWVKEKGGHALQLYAPLRNAEYYKKMGFKNIGVFEKGWFGLDHYIFTKQI